MPAAWKLDSAPKVPMFWVTPKEGGPYAFDSFDQCWNDKENGLKKRFSELGKSEDDVKSIDTAIGFFGKIEEELEDCSGACALPLFGIKAKVSGGPAKKECVENIIESLDTLLGPGIVCLLTFFVLIAACCGGCTLCRGFNKDDLEQG